MKRGHIHMFSVLTALTLIAASAADAGPARVIRVAGKSQACFRAADVESWSAVDRRTVNLRVGVKDIYQLKLFADCGDIDFSERIGLQSRGSDWICSGVDATVIAPTSTGPERCMATDLHRLTPAEVAALPPRQKP